jgi:ribosomal protein S18 acetylase RimI-like enzyme
VSQASPELRDGDPAQRARAWHHASQAAVCDVIEPWAHGTVVRATRYPNYWDFNVVRVEEEPKLSVDDLAAFADDRLAGLEHRRVDLERAEAAEPLREGFKALGWRTARLVWMRHEVPAPPGPSIEIERVPYEAVNDLRVAWHVEDFPDQPASGHLEDEREVALLHGAEVLAVHEGGTPVAFAQLQSDGRSAEITQVYVSPSHRGNGLGTALTTAAITAAADSRDLWIVADDEGRPKELYGRLGFRPAWKGIEALRFP